MANGASWGGAAKLLPQSLFFNFCSEIEMDYESLGKIRHLSFLSSRLYEALQSVSRIQRGSPGAGQLGPIVSSYRLAFQCQEIFTWQSHFPGMRMLQFRLGELQKVLARQFNDEGNDPGYNERVSLLEELHYTNGALQSVLVKMIIKQNAVACWKYQKLSPPFNICSEIQLDIGSLSIIRNLSVLSINFRQALQDVTRIQRGSPAAGQLGATFLIYRSQFDLIALQCQEIFTKQSHFLVMRMLQFPLGELQKLLALQFNDEGNDPGYNERVCLLEELHYTNGALNGVVEMIIEQHVGIAYWKCLNLANPYGHLQNIFGSQSG